MTQLVLNNLDDDLTERLQARAAEHGVSPEEEARQILNAALEDEEKLPHFTPEENAAFSDFLASMPNVGRDEDFARLPGNIRAAEL